MFSSAATLCIEPLRLRIYTVRTSNLEAVQKHCPLCRVHCKTIFKMIFRRVFTTFERPASNLKVPSAAD